MAIMEVCDRCGQIIKEGDMRYKIRIMSAADDGGVVPEPILDDELEALISGLEGVDSSEITRQVFEERIYILCPPCKKDFLGNPFDMGQSDRYDGDIPRVLH